MKFTVPTKEFSQALSDCTPTTFKRTLPVLGCVKLEVADSALVLSTTDLDLWITRRVSATAKKKGSALVAFDLLSRIVNRVTASTIEFDLKGKILELTADTITANFETLPVEEFPELLHIPDDANQIDCEAADFLKHLRAVEHGMSNDQNQYVYMGVNFRSHAGDTLLTATNKKLLSSIKWKKETKGIEATFPAAGVHAILKIFKDGAATVSISDTCFAVNLDDDAAEIRGKLIEGKFPSFHHIFPDPPLEKAFAARRADIIEAVKTVSLFLDKKDETGIIFTGKGKQIEIACGKKGKVLVLGSDLTDQPKFEIKVNPQYLLKILQSMSGEFVRIEAKHPTPFVFHEENFSSILNCLVQQ